ncbi:hypothetical protein CXG81DRAFT_26656 [Caulochytrium protostelioides]|uniref:MPN domain-containing protein n=1 Tax=Caulochytrium protostelioides TaxID=1555241 RepID=A0A4P9X6K3_9FUNG|nr:hypothetical protein CXG81DRAFT_26656 [Caulochytrium protostelioides]|eukprot:RKP00631.1 hypothetical protein CXG81DRAFT_26656 [Caulochytrium protostelioides]
MPAATVPSFLALDFAGPQADASPEVASAMAPASFSVSVSPVIVLSALDHYLRRLRPADRVVGAVFGVRASDNAALPLTYADDAAHVRYVSARASLPLQIEEEEDSIVVACDALRTLCDVHARTARPGEELIGWYTTTSGAASTAAGALDTKSIWLHEFFQSKIDGDAIALLIDTASFSATEAAANADPATLGVPVRCYTCAKIGAAVPEYAANLFTPILCQVTGATGTAEEEDPEQAAALYALARARDAAAEVAPAMSAAVAAGSASREPSTGSLAPVMSEMRQFETTLTHIRAMLARVQAFVSKTMDAPKISAEDARVGRYLMEVLSQMPKMADASDVEASFQGHVQDLLLVLYLANITKTQLAAAERLYKMA